MELSPTDQTLILTKLAAVRRDLHALSNAIMALETSVRTKDLQGIARYFQ